LQSPLTEKLTAHEKLDTPLPPELIEIVNSWENLPEHIKQTIRTLMSSVTVTSEDNKQ
jgi:hypothetical protein